MFDIDKDYIMKMVFDRIVKDGKVTYEKPKKGRAARNNLIVATQLAVLQSEQVQKQLFTPGNFEEPKKYGYLISYVQNEAKRTGRDPEGIWAEAVNWDNDKLKDANKVSNNLIFSHVQVQFHKQNMTAGKLIGIFAQSNVSHAFISLAHSTTDGKGGINHPALNIPEELSFKINGITVGENFLIDEILTRNKETNVSNNLASLLAASVDAVKDPILNLINININTANIVTALVRMGFSIETVSLFVSQPVIVDLIRDYSIQSAEKYVDLGALISSRIEEMPEDVKQIEELSVDTDALISNLNGDSTVTNYVVLEIFNRMRTIADTFGDITHMTRYNSITSAAGPFASDSMVQRIKNAAFETNLLINDAVREACNNPILTGFRSIADGPGSIESRLLGNHLIQAGTRFETTLNVLGKRLGFSRGVPAKIANAFSDFYMSFYVNANPDGSVFDLGIDNRRYVLQDFPKDFARLKGKFKDNILINSIQYVESDREEFGFLQLKTRGLSSSILEDIKQAWITLYESEDPNAKNIALRLAEYNFFRGSFGFSPKTFMNLVPNIIKANLNMYVSTLEGRTSMVEMGDMTDRIITQFILHNQNLVIDRYRDIESYGPEELTSDVYGTVIQLSRKPKEGKKGRKADNLVSRRPIIKIDEDFYYVLPDNTDPDTILVKKVDALGGNGQGFEISVTEDFPKSVYSSNFTATQKEGKGNPEDAFTKDNLSEKDLGILVEQLFEDDESLFEAINDLSSKKVIARMNEELSSRGIPQRLGQTARIKNKLVRVLERVEGIDNPRELLNKSEKTISELGFCN